MTPKRITYDVRDDGPGPDVGDVLLSTRSAYVVVSSRAVRTRDGCRRFALGVIRYSVEDYPSGNTRTKHFDLKWNSRASKRTRARPYQGDAPNV